ncbi:MAG TPA: sodium/calcium exchanger protein, partial [Chloroflexota bacterium]|nr:sodium/calcium exchanger protein [Chloroflexota bacterium]
MVATAAAPPAPIVRSSRLPIWLLLMIVGFVLWAALFVRNMMLGEAGHATEVTTEAVVIAVIELITGLLIIQGACEALVQAVERLGARLKWDGYVAGTAGEILSTLPEFVVIALLVAVEPIVAFTVALVTIFNNALAFSVYSFFLPKDKTRMGSFVMPTAITKAGGEVLIAACGISLVVGLAMLGLRAGGAGGEALKSEFSGPDLIVVAVVMFVIFGAYVLSLVRNFSHSEEHEKPADPHTAGHPTGWAGIIGLLVLGIVGAVLGGESVSAFADTAINSFRLPEIPTAIGLAFFAGVSEYVIVYKAHRKGELGIALSNVFGGVTQVMFLVFPFTLLVIGLYGVFGSAHHTIPINFTTSMLILLLFPLFFVLLEYLEEDHTLS